MSYEKVIEQIKDTPVELLDEVSIFLNFLKYRSNQNLKAQKLPDETYNQLVGDISDAVTNSAHATIWEQIKNDTW